MAAFVDGCVTNSLRFGRRFSALLLGFHDVLGLPLFLIGVPVFLRILLVDGGVTDALGLLARMAAGLLAFGDVFDLTMLLRAVSMFGSHASSVPGRTSTNHGGLGEGSWFDRLTMTLPFDKLRAGSAHHDTSRVCGAGDKSSVSMETAATEKRVTMEEITALAKRRGFIFQSSEIYGGINGFWDYGPLGAVLKRNVKDAWWRDTVELRDDVVAFDSSIVMHPLVWKASGHVDAFHDVMIDCKVCKHRFRADHLNDRSQCPDCGSKDSFTEPRNFNLMMRTSVGPMEDTSAVAYLRPETAQGIFVNFKNIYQTRAQAAAVRRRADRQIVSQRDHAGKLHLSACASSNRPSSSISFPTTAKTWRPFASGSSAARRGTRTTASPRSACGSTS